MVSQFKLLDLHFSQVLYIPSEFSLHVYDRLMTHGQNYGIRNGGYYALRSLRIEKFFLYWGQDIDSGYSMTECWLWMTQIINIER